MSDSNVPEGAERILLSPPDVGEEERQMLLAAFDSNWIAPVGPQVDAFEREVAALTGRGHAAALSSGTAGLHLALILAGVAAGDEVITSTLTFAATANAICYVGATPVFVDVDSETWQLDPALLEEELATCAKRGRMPGAVIAVDLYGQCADYDRLVEMCDRYGVPLIEDAAEALGATYRTRPAGSFGQFSVLSFNGNKIITTSGGGMLLADREEAITRARFLATQARDPAPYYLHSCVGYNYRLSNLLAAVGRAQLRGLTRRVAIRQAHREAYREALSTIAGVDLMPEAEYGGSNAWLTCLTIDPAAAGGEAEELRVALEARNIEARPVWKPLHQQPVFDACRAVNNGVADRLFARGLCLPSGSSMSPRQRQRVIDAVVEHFNRRRLGRGQL